jgi:glycosyltransferase involved in cell wall biosynthesis
MALPLVSVVIPTFNVRNYIEHTLRALAASAYEGDIELCVHDDGSSDGTWEWLQTYLWTRGPFRLSRSDVNQGAGRARNECIARSTGEYLCFNDADDVSHVDRLPVQLEAVASCGADPRAVIAGARFVRDPPDATSHYAQFMNSLSDADLLSKQYREVSLLLSTWFMSKSLFERVGPFAQARTEDLEWFHRALDLGHIRWIVAQPARPLVVYRHVGGSLCSQTPRRVLVEIRVRAFERRVLDAEPWRAGFYIWGAGRDGRTFFAELQDRYRSNVLGFFDVDAGKIQSGFHHPLLSRALPTVHVSQAKAPFVVCVAMGRTDGAMEANVRGLNLQEGRDFWFFA